MASSSEKLQRLFADLDEAPELGIPAEELVAVVRAAEEFIETMAIRYSDIEGREIPRGFTQGSSDAALVQFDALAALDEKLADAG